MGEFPRLTLRDWTACDPATQTRVLDWSDHPQVPAHASRAMMAISVMRALRKVPLPGHCLEVHSWVAYDSDRPVAFVAAELLSKWIPPEEFFPEEPDLDLLAPVMSFSTLVDPGLWGRGYSTAAKTAVYDHPAAARTKTFHACIRADNDRSLKAISKTAGIRLMGTAVDNGHQWLHFRWQPNS